MWGWIQSDCGCPRSKHHKLLQKVGSDLISVSTEVLDPIPVRCGEHPYIVPDVVLRGSRKRFNLNVYFIHVSEYHTVKLNEHCILLSDHPLDDLLRKRAEQSTMAPVQKLSSVAA